MSWRWSYGERGLAVYAFSLSLSLSLSLTICDNFDNRDDSYLIDFSHCDPEDGQNFSRYTSKVVLATLPVRTDNNNNR